MPAGQQTRAALSRKEGERDGAGKARASREHETAPPLLTPAWCSLCGKSMEPAAQRLLCVAWGKPSASPGPSSHPRKGGGNTSEGSGE